MKPKPNIIKVAIEAAGGNHVVAAHFGISRPAVHYWIKTNRVPAKYINELARLGEHLISTERILDYIHEHGRRRFPSELAESEAAA